MTNNDEGGQHSVDELLAENERLRAEVQDAYERGYDAGYAQGMLDQDE